MSDASAHPTPLSAVLSEEKVSQSWLAGRLCVGRSAVSMWCTGALDVPHIRRAQIAATLGRSVEDIDWFAYRGQRSLSTDQKD